MTAIDIFWVGIGGGSGSLLRWWVGKLTGERYHGHFPLGTFIINISGAFIIGFLSTLFVIDWHDRFGSFLHAAVQQYAAGCSKTGEFKTADAVFRLFAYLCCGGSGCCRTGCLAGGMRITI